MGSIENAETISHEEKLEFMRELHEKVTSILETELKEPDDWVRVKTLIAREIAKLLGKYNDCLEEVYLIELSGGEPVNEYEGGLDIDLYIRARNCGKRIEAFWPLVEEIVKEALVLTKSYEFIKNVKKLFGKGFSHNLVEFHINKDYLEPLIKSKYYYKQKLYPGS